MPIPQHSAKFLVHLQIFGDKFQIVLILCTRYINRKYENKKKSSSKLMEILIENFKIF